MNTISTLSTPTYGWDGSEVCEYEVELTTCQDFDTPSFNPSVDGIRDAAKRHDALARRKYAKPFKWFKFNRARRGTAK